MFLSEPKSYTFSGSATLVSNNSPLVLIFKKNFAENARFSVQYHFQRVACTVQDVLFTVQLVC
jgi:hypothetical protein